ncbi:MAG: PEGA domain-containing protein [Planctomycetota bacterium]|jgi:hypothetical protein|nr:PEGA domain-containing protein [Planctomycetota bacterium]MDP6761627.1 PEGA domain-containing protein [Planctomycetota bacterium]MDP6989527.1 PEGA domain-containing protein [Planctomycetota bacterium]
MNHHAPSTRRRALLAACLALAWTPLCGCQVRRVIELRSQPPGATVRLDDRLVGETPLDLPFVHHGTRRVTCTLEGYQPLVRVVEIDAPWWARFPLDLFSEVLLPLGWRDVHRVEIALEPEGGELDESELRALLRKAETLRRAGPTGPRPEQPPPRPGEEPSP